MGCGVCSKKAFGRFRAAPLETSESECLRSETPAVSSTYIPSRYESGHKAENSRHFNGGHLVCLSAHSSNEALARHIAEELSRQLHASQRLFSMGLVLESTRVHVALIDASGDPAPSCEVLIPLLTPEWLSAARCMPLLRHTQRHRALSLGPELLPLLTLQAFGNKPEVLMRALNSEVGELLREVAAPGSWGRLENRATLQAGIEAAASWLVLRIETLLCPVETSVHLLGKRGNLKSYRRPNFAATPPGFGKTLPDSTGERNHASAWTRDTHPHMSEPTQSTPADMEPTVILAEVPDEFAVSSSPKRPPGMPSLRKVSKDRNPVMLEPHASDLEDLLAAHLGENCHSENIGTAKRFLGGSLRQAAASSRPVTPLLPQDKPTTNANHRRGAGESEAAEHESVRWASTTAWADLVRQECGSAEDPFSRLNGVSKGIVEQSEFAPIPTSAVTQRLPPPPLSPPPISLRGHWRRAAPWRPFDGEIGNPPHNQSVGPSSGSNSAPPTPRGREEDWDHFNLRGELAPSVTAAEPFGDMSSIAPSRSFVQSEPSSPRETSFSWGQADLGRTTMRKTCWGDTATWLKNNFRAHEKVVQEEDAWDELDEVYIADDTQGNEVHATQNQPEFGQKRGPLAPEGLPPLPCSPVHRQKKTEVSASYANAFGAGFLREPVDDQTTLEGQCGRFVLGDAFPTLTTEHGGKRLAFGSKYVSMDCTLNRKVVVWHFQVPEGSCMTQHVGMRGAIAAEVGKLKQVRHPRLCPYLGSELMQGELYVVTSYAPGGSVADWLHDAGSLDEGPTRRVVHAVLEGLQHLHDNVHLAHGGIRAGNVLLGPGAAVRLADFGLSSILHRRGLNIVGIEHNPEPTSCSYGSWRPPEFGTEVSSGEAVSEAGDIWAFAWLVVAILAGFAIAAQVGSLNADKARVPILMEHLSPGACNMVQKCLRTRSSERPSAKLLLGDPWLACAPLYRE